MLQERGNKPQQLLPVDFDGRPATRPILYAGVGKEDGHVYYAAKTLHSSLSAVAVLGAAPHKQAAYSRMPLLLSPSAEHSNGSLVETAMAQQSLTPRQGVMPQKLRPERRILGDLSNTQCPGTGGGCGGEKREASGRPKPTRDAFRVFTGGENENEPPSKEAKSTETSVRWSDIAALGFEELPDIDCFANPEPADAAKYWKPFWEGGPADPRVLAEGLANTMDLADLEAQRMDALIREGLQTPTKNQDLDLDLPLPSPPSISPFGMDVDFDAEPSRPSGPSPRRLNLP
eukprot:s26_g41.t1